MSLRARLAMDQRAEGSQSVSRKRRASPGVSSNNRDTPEVGKPSKRQKLSRPAQVDQARADVQTAFEDDLNCPICLELMVGCQIINPCGHMACGICSDQWITQVWHYPLTPLAGEANYMRVQRPNPTCHTCREPASPLKALIPCRSFDSIIEKHIMVLEASGNVDWLKEGQKRKDWDRRIGEWADIKNRPLPGVERRHGLRRAVQQADDHAALLHHMFAHDDESDDDLDLDPETLEVLRGEALRGAEAQFESSDDGSDSDGIEIVGAPSRRNLSAVTEESTESESEDGSESEEAGDDEVQIVMPQGVHWEDGGEEWHEGEVEGDGGYDDAPDFHDVPDFPDGLYDLDDEDYPDAPYFEEGADDEDGAYDADVPYYHDADESLHGEEDYEGELYEEEEPELHFVLPDIEPDIELEDVDIEEVDDAELNTVHERLMAESLRNHLYAERNARLMDHTVTRDPAGRTAAREARRERVQPTALAQAAPAPSRVPVTPAGAGAPTLPVIARPRHTPHPARMLFSARFTSPPPRPSTSVNRRRAPSAERNAPRHSEDEDRGQAIIRGSIADQLQRLRGMQRRENAHPEPPGPIRTHRRFSTPPGGSTHRRFMSPAVALPATPPITRRSIPLTPPSPDDRTVRQGARRTAPPTPSGSRTAPQARHTPAPTRPPSQQQQQRRPDERRPRQYAHDSVPLRHRPDAQRPGNGNANGQQMAETTTPVVRVRANPTARRGRR
ncbi:hypothetical protein CALVIDRAFT_318559 [Calocera viscosa TUFC12733]|uniref:RING-type domain-containing protein n=1 Tax=Calocera viscosa (strain TUFC12733) TaxID=1330018 RepID=A0A167HXL2_CALVF|nr:hypothetical protein CALVIDRAFT_318559 [Calocera viscosa TUFC12733]